MAIVEEVADQGDRDEDGTDTKANLLSMLRQLSKRLALPEDLLPSFMSEEKSPEALGIYRNRTLGVLRQFLDKTRSSAWNQLSILDHTDVMIDVFRLYGDDPWTSSAIRDIIDRSFPSTMSFRLKADKTHSEIASTLPTSALATHLLSTPLRSIFSPTPHPMLNPTSSRALSRPAGGADAQSDFHDSTTQLYKSHAGWGCYNILSWCTSQLSPDELEKRIGVVLPPTLVMMDDYEAAWRGRGVSVLKGWMDKVSVVVMSRMGMDKLLLDSLIHTLSLHANPPLPHVLPVALRLIERSTSGARRAERYAEIMDKAVIQGWTYAPLGQEGRPMLINIAKELELLCSTCGVGITRWLKTIIPNLLEPLQYPPSPTVLLHYIANLSALLCVTRLLSKTGRSVRWRGQIIDVLARLWLQLRERGDQMRDHGSNTEQRVNELVISLFAELELQCPSVADNEYDKLLKLEPDAFRELIPSH